MDGLSLESISKEFFSHSQIVKAVDDVSLSIKDREFASIVGPSGCGKSTLLNIISGLESPSSGKVYVDGQLHSGINPRIGYISQQDNLLPWRNVLSNLEISLEIRGVSKDERKTLARRWIEKLGLVGFESHYPHELSGGMRSRVSLGRTLIYNPEILLMDEPFSALDAQTKIVLEDELLRLWSETHKTIVFVTHDLAEAILLSDRTIVMTSRPGKVKRVYDIHLPRPRVVSETQYSPEYLEAYRRIWVDLEEEVKRSMLIEVDEGASRKKEIIESAKPL